MPCDIERLRKLQTCQVYKRAFAFQNAFANFKKIELACPIRKCKAYWTVANFYANTILQKNVIAYMYFSSMNIKCGQK